MVDLEELMTVQVSDNEVLKVVVSDLCGKEKIYFSEVFFKEELIKDGCKYKYKIKEVDSDIRINCHYPVLDKGTNRLVIETNGSYKIWLESDDSTIEGSMAKQRVVVKVIKISRDKAMALKFEDWQRI